MNKKQVLGILFAPIFSYIFIIVWISTEWGKINITMFGDDEAYKKFCKEFSFVTLSHRGDLDWVAGLTVAFKFNHLGDWSWMRPEMRIRTLPKWSVFYVPGFGQMFWHLECPFLKRNFADDKKNIAKFSDIWETYPFPIMVAIFCEGTRFTTEKYEKGCQYARERGLPVFKHHLFPRTKGFAILAEHLKSGTKFKSLYDIGFAYPKLPQKYIPSFIHLFLGREINLYWYMRRIPIEELPDGHEELNTYCIKLYQHKDEAYQHFIEHGVFPGKRQPPLSDIGKWLIRFNILFWFLAVVVLPLVLMFLTLSWNTLAVMMVLGGLGNTALLLGMLKYAQGARVVADVPQTDIEEDKKTN